MSNCHDVKLSSGTLICPHQMLVRADKRRKNMTISQFLKQRIDTLAVIEQATPVKRIASTCGGEWAGPCPFCGGEDRFHVQPYTPGGGRWMCRHCTYPRWPDIIEFVQRLYQCGYHEACRYLMNGPILLSSLKPATLKIEKYAMPDEVWQSRARALVDECANRLWSRKGQEALRYLRSRSIPDQAIFDFQLGYNPRDYYAPSEQWGIKINDDGRHDGVWIPRGITIPGVIGQNIWYVKIRRFVREPRYLHISGGCPALYGADDLNQNEIIVLFEGELDCIAAKSILGGTVGCATFGSASSRNVVRHWSDYFFSKKIILIVFDEDETGRASSRLLEEIIPGSRRLRIPVLKPGDKDVTDYLLAGGNLQSWLNHHLKLLGIYLPDRNGSSIVKTEEYSSSEEMIDLNKFADGRYLIDPTLPCTWCGGTKFNPCTNGDGFVCSRCHPSVETLLNRKVYHVR